MSGMASERGVLVWMRREVKVWKGPTRPVGLPVAMIPCYQYRSEELEAANNSGSQSEKAQRNPTARGKTQRRQRERKRQQEKDGVLNGQIL
jgi:hypothetical protein